MTYTPTVLPPVKGYNNLFLLFLTNWSVFPNAVTNEMQATNGIKVEPRYSSHPWDKREWLD